MSATQPPLPERTTTYSTSRLGILVRAEISLREAGRALECSIDPELQRLSKIVFRLASRCRTDRLGEVLA